ncbi:MAG TPA: hypothetical protein VL049_08725, partial [Candidatus Dormibacteraeota bacterium]|nr:hypothetical protein [Candidatus Dormibacteraeota bacterium]
ALALLGARRPAIATLALLGLAAADLYRVNGQLLPTVAWDDLRRVPRRRRAWRWPPPTSRSAACPSTCAARWC